MMSLGFIRPGEHAALRGPMVSGIVQQMLQHTLWGDLDILLLDLPPGTGDVHLTVAQMGAGGKGVGSGGVDAAVVVTTPQKLSLVDVEKGIKMFDTVQIPTVAVVENMSVFHCPHCEKPSSIYGEMGSSGDPMDSAARQLASAFGIEMFHALPIDPRVAFPKRVFVNEKSNETRPAFQAFHSLAADVFMLTSTGKLRTGSEQNPELQYDPATGMINLVQRTTPSAKSVITGAGSMPQDLANTPVQVLGSVISRDLRMKCRSADMFDEFTRKKLFKDKDIAMDVRPKKVEPAGRYAVRVDWNDGHSSLFPYKKLKEIMVLHQS